jgi:hypothetical protein
MKYPIIIGIMLIGFMHSSNAKQATMPTEFIGEWCYESGSDDPKVRVDEKFSYVLPSWVAEGETCDRNKILSIESYGFYFNDEHTQFVPVSGVSKVECAHTGCGTSAKIIAREPWPDNAKARIFLMSRYKGHLTVEQAKGATAAEQIRCFWNMTAKGCPKYDFDACTEAGCTFKKSHY